MATFDNRNQKVDTQYNADRININVQPTQDASALFRKGKQLLEAKAYGLAINTLEKAINVDPSIANAHYNLALALLKGRRPKVLTRGEIKKIDEALSTSIALNSSNGLFHWFRVLVRDDYYNGHRMVSPAPSVQEIISTAMLCETNINELRLLLQKLPMHNNDLYIAIKQNVT